MISHSQQYGREKIAAHEASHINHKNANDLTKDAVIFCCVISRALGKATEKETNVLNPVVSLTGVGNWIHLNLVAIKLTQKIQSREKNAFRLLKPTIMLSFQTQHLISSF